MPPTHKQTFWAIDAGAGDIGADKRAQIAKAALMLQQRPFIAHASSASGYSNVERPEIALTVVTIFTELEGITDEVNGLKNTLVEISNTTKTDTAVLVMVLGGIAAVGTSMVAVYSAITAAGSLSAAIASAIAAIGGVLLLVGIVEGVAAAVLAKDAVNKFVLINGLDKKVNYVKDWIIDGERFKITLEVPEAEKSSMKPYAYGCAIYTYRKTRWLDHPVGFFSSNAGAAFKASDGTEFSIGTNCPNTTGGGRNCIHIRSDRFESKAKLVAMSAASSGYSKDSIEVNGHSCIASRASA